MSLQAADIEDVRKSYGRALVGDKVLADFYQVFLASSPDIKGMFAKTDLKRQQGLLREGISFLLLYAQGSQVAKAKVEKLRETHSHAHLNVKPAMYSFWVNSLLTVMRKHDPEYSEALDQKWRNVLEKGIAHMKAGY